MGRDSSGTYTRTQSNYSFNTVISETQINSELNDIAAELTLSLEASGKKAWTGNQNCGSQKMTALAVGSALTDSTNLGQVQNGGMQYATGSGTNTIVATMAPAITAYVAGQTFRIKMAAGANTGATTLNLNSVGAKNITKRGTTALAAGDIPASMMFEVAYDGTQFQLINVGQDIDTDTGITSLAADSSPQLGGFLDANGNYIQMQKGGDIASQSPTVVDTDGDYFICTGTTNFSAFTVAADRHFFLEFAAVLTMTHGAGTLDLPSGANITTAAGDVGEFVSTASNVVTCVNYSTASGKALVESVTLANSVTLTNKTLTTPAVTNLTGTFNSPTGTIGAMTLGGAVTGGDQIVSAINLKDYGEVTNALGSAGGTRTIDLTLGNSVSATVSASTNTFVFSNPTASDELCAFSLMLTNGGSQSVAWPSSTDFAGSTAPTLTTSGVDCLVFWTIDGGTIWNGSTVALNLS